LSPSTPHLPHPFVRLLKYGRAYRRRFWQATTCSILNKLFDLAPPLLIGVAVDVVVQQQNSWLTQFGLESVQSQLLAVVLASLVIWSLESLFEYAYARLWRNLAQQIQHDLRLDAYAHIQELELEYFESSSTGRMMSILNDDINQLERFLDYGANEVLQVAATVVIIGAIFFYMTPGWRHWRCCPCRLSSGGR